MNEILLLNKPKGMTSFTAVKKCRTLLHEKKAGHTGTLDPNAEGLMIILLGRYTKLAPYCISNHKSYLATFSFGMHTDTDDCWGTAAAHKTPAAHTLEEINAAAEKLTGDILQVPPMYSAVHVNGKKLYELARKGIEVERKPRPVHVDSIEIKSIGENSWSMEAVVSSGTYIRTLIRDLGTLLNEYAYMTSLKRTGIEDISITEAQTMSEIAEHPHAIDPLRILDPAYQVVEAPDPDKIRNGMSVHLPSESKQVIVTSKGTILAAYEKREDGYYHCLRGLM